MITPLRGKNMHRILALNPGSTSTKLALFEGEAPLWTREISYSKEKLSGFSHVSDQLEMRLADIEMVLEEQQCDIRTLSAVVGRGGPFKPLESGTYAVSAAVLDDIRNNRVQAEHISNIGPVLARALAEKAGIPSYFVDPVSVDEFIPLARISGLPELERKSLVHALNIKATARKAADDLKRPLDTLNLVVAHLGGGISICAMQRGRIIDVNNANEGGPFSPERAGSLPVSSLVKLCYSGHLTYEAVRKRIIGNGGLAAHLGTHDSLEVEKRISNNDARALLVYEAMAYQIAKEIGAMASVLSGKVDAIVVTGGLARSDMLIAWIRSRVAFIAPVLVFPGENELEALALGALRVLNGEENAKVYEKEIL